MGSEASDVSSDSDSTHSRFTALFGKRASSRKEPLVSTSKTNSHESLADNERLSKLEREIAALRALNDVNAIMFCSLGFKTRVEVESWLLKFSPNTSFGLVVDVHMVCEHLHAQLFGRDSTLGNLQNLAKLKFKSDTEGLTVTSFERRIPKIFVKSVAFKVVKSDVSYFDTIISYSEWSSPEDGFRDTFLRLLKEFQHDHQHLLVAELDQTSTFYQVAHSSLTVSISWLEELVRYIDDTYNVYVESKFNSKKAWNITTRLAKPLLGAISEPRNG